MNSLSKLVSQIYGDKLIKQNSKSYTHHLFQSYINKQTKEHYFLTTIELPAYYYISDAGVQLAINKYGTLLFPMEFLQFERNFQQHTYLIKSSKNIITLENFIDVKRDCKEVIQKDFILKLFEFLQVTYDKIMQKKLPIFQFKQVGITEAKQFILCDPIIYFRKKCSSLQILDSSFEKWIYNFLKDLTKINSKDQEYIDVKLEQLLGENQSPLKQLIKDIILQKITKKSMENYLILMKNRISDEVTTITSSFINIDDIPGNQSLKSTLLVKKHKMKMGTLLKITFAVVMVLLIVGAVYFGLIFFKKGINCEQSYFLNDKNQCLLCGDGCLKCESAETYTCMKCVNSMYLMLEEEDDKQGFCMKECKGRKIRINDCVKDKNDKQKLTIAKQ